TYMDVEIGHIQAIYRYPVKSMAGEALERIPLGWHGLEGDRRFAFRRVRSHTEQGGFPWLTASKLPSLILYQPVRQDTAPDNHLPTHVRTPDGNLLAIRSDALRDDISRRFGSEVELMQLKHGIFDEAPVSLLSLATSRKITDDSRQPPDIRRFRPNIVIDTGGNEPFAEDQWVGKTVTFGETDDSPALQVTLRDLRCVMVNLHPDTAQSDPAVLKTVAQLNETCAGVYATVIRTGTLAVGQPVYLR
ncbi:MAG: MOSC domain-containing protein, partial [Anaerolineae bacterium]|nr:MOSC domain-containing protein [Anaerolineae bacterium]